jgi:hypothetical protein
MILSLNPSNHLKQLQSTASNHVSEIYVSLAGVQWSPGITVLIPLAKSELGLRHAPILHSPITSEADLEVQKTF